MTDGAWGTLLARFGEWMRRKADLEDWPAFVQSFHDFVDLLADLASSDSATPLRSIAVISGDAGTRLEKQITSNGWAFMPKPINPTLLRQFLSAAGQAQ